MPLPGSRDILVLVDLNFSYEEKITKVTNPVTAIEATNDTTRSLSRYVSSYCYVSSILLHVSSYLLICIYIYIYTYIYITISRWPTTRTAVRSRQTSARAAMSMKNEGMGSTILWKREVRINLRLDRSAFGNKK